MALTAKYPEQTSKLILIGSIGIDKNFMNMKKIKVAMVLLVLFTLIVTGTSMAENINKKGDVGILTPEEEAGLLFMDRAIDGCLSQ